jgi:hypothetical protein
MKIRGRATSVMLEMPIRSHATVGLAEAVTVPRQRTLTRPI